MELRVLNRHRELRGQGRHESRFVLGQDAPLRREDAEKPDDLVLREERHSDHRLDAGLRRCVRDSDQARIGEHVVQHEHAA